MSLNIEHIYKNALCNLQLLAEKIGIDVGVGSLNNDDWLFLSGCNSDLNWDCIVTNYASFDSSINLSVKFRNNDDSALLGASICLCDMQEKSFNVCGIERFSRNKSDCPLKGKMIFLVLSLTFLISYTIEIDFIRLVDVDKSAEELRSYYKTFGFDIEQKNPKNMIVDLDVLKSNLSK